MSSSSHSRRRRVAVFLLAGLGCLAFVSLTRRGDTQPPPTVPRSLESARDANPRDEPPRTTPDAPQITTSPSLVPPPHPRLSRAQHDKLAQQIRDRLRAARPEASAEPDAPAKPRGFLNRAVIQEIVSEKFIGPARECYDRVLADDPGFHGKVSLQFTILGEDELGGVVDEVTLADETDVNAISFTDCLREAMYEIRFDSPEGGGVVTVTYPFNFAPG